MTPEGVRQRAPPKTPSGQIAETTAIGGKAHQNNPKHLQTA